jgi:hypothetical protein
MLVASELDKPATDSWIYYKTWEYKAGKSSGLSVPKDVNILLIHGESRSTIGLSLTKQLMYLPLSSFRLSRVHVGRQFLSITWWEAEAHRASYHAIASRGQCAYMAQCLLEAGFRIILLDLPGVSINSLLHTSEKTEVDSMRRRICVAWPIYRVKSVDGQPESHVYQRTDVDIAFTHAMLGQSTRSYRASITLDLGYQTRVTGPP